MFLSLNGKTIYAISASAYKILIIDIKSRKIKNMFEITFFSELKLFKKD